jgi:tRNA-Thr(GGU) m(6)t(6)A37 methyltransferase TsaA
MIQFKPIGIVHNAMTEAHRDTRWDEIESRIVVNDEWCDALDGIKAFSHIWVVFYLDRVPPFDSLRVQPMGRDDMPLVGRFATRTPSRPNPIGICAVPLLEVRGNVLRVRGLDALDGTPVLDLKPYLARGDAIENTRVAEWVEKYWATPEANGA